jgi:phospholipid/cholesterol/gamma-HCH transport system ATP-binding protein
LQGNKPVAWNKPVRPEHVIEIDNLGKGFGNDLVLKNLSLKLYNGENLVVLGKSGSGKSVLIKCIVRLLILTMEQSRYSGRM